MKHGTACRLALALPLCASVLLLGAAHGLLRRAEAARRECAACSHALESLSPLLEEVYAYGAVKAALRDAGGGGPAPEPRLGVPPAERATAREAVRDGWVAVRETFSWPSLKTGQAFAVLESFASAEPWRIAALRLAALPDGENASLSVTLESVEPVAGRE